MCCYFYIWVKARVGNSVAVTVHTLACQWYLWVSSLISRAISNTHAFYFEIPFSNQPNTIIWFSRPHVISEVSLSSYFISVFFEVRCNCVSRSTDIRLMTAVCNIFFSFKLLLTKLKPFSNILQLTLQVNQVWTGLATNDVVNAQLWRKYNNDHGGQCTALKKLAKYFPYIQQTCHEPRYRSRVTPKSMTILCHVGWVWSGSHRTESGVISGMLLTDMSDWPGSCYTAFDLWLLVHTVLERLFWTLLTHG